MWRMPAQLRPQPDPLQPLRPPWSATRVSSHGHQCPSGAIKRIGRAGEERCGAVVLQHPALAHDCDKGLQGETPRQYRASPDDRGAEAALDVAQFILGLGADDGVERAEGLAMSRTARFSGKRRVRRRRAAAGRPRAHVEIFPHRAPGSSWKILSNSRTRTGCVSAVPSEEARHGGDVLGHCAVRK